MLFWCLQFILIYRNTVLVSDLREPVYCSSVASNLLHLPRKCIYLSVCMFVPPGKICVYFVFNNMCLILHVD